MPTSINGNTGGGASAPAGTGVVTVSSGAFVDPVASAATTRAALDAQQDVFTTRGDLVRAGVSGVAERLPLGANGYVLTSDGTDAAWAAAGGGGGNATSIQGVAVDATAPTTGQTITYDGTKYIPTTPGGGTPTWLALYGGSAFYMGGMATFGFTLNDYITAGAASAVPAFGPGQSVVLCLYPGAAPTALEAIASHGNGTSRGFLIEFGRDAGNRTRPGLYLFGLTGTGTAGTIPLVGAEWTAGTPYVLAIAIQADKSVRYSVNGGAVQTVAALSGTYSAPSSADTLRVGSTPDFAPSYYPPTSVIVGALRCYSTELSDADLVSACAGRTTGTIPAVGTGTINAAFDPSAFAGGVRVVAASPTPTWVAAGNPSIHPV